MWGSRKEPLPEVYNIPTSSIPTYPAVQSVQQNEGWWQRNYKNKPQSNSAGTASLIFISGGMNMAWGLGFTLDHHHSMNMFFITKNLILSWFIGGIIGVIVGALACNHVPKKILMCISSILVTICGILQVADSNSYDAILASRYLNGIAVGLVFPMTFVLIGEEVIKSMRGMTAVGVDAMSFSCGIFIQVIYSFSWSSDMNNDFNSTQMGGVLNITWGILAFVMATLLIVESPVFYLAKDQEQIAIDSLRRLQRPFTITYETYEQLEEHKRYLAESKEKTFLQNAIYGLPALAKLCIYRSFMALGFSFFVNFAFTTSSQTGALAQLDLWPYMLYGLARFVGPLIVMFTLDSKGRKSPMIIGFCICTILAFTAGGIYDNKQHFFNVDYMNVVKYILIFYQFFASISLCSSSAYLSEAFPLAVKPYFIAIVFIVEMLVHIIIICCSNTFLQFNIFSLSKYFLTLGSLSLVFLIAAILIMPETKWNTLRECLLKFRKLNNFNS